MRTAFIETVRGRIEGCVHAYQEGVRIVIGKTVREMKKEGYSPGNNTVVCRRGGQRTASSAINIEQRSAMIASFATRQYTFPFLTF